MEKGWKHVVCGGSSWASAAVLTAFPRLPVAYQWSLIAPTAVGLPLRRGDRSARVANVLVARHRGRFLLLAVLLSLTGLVGTTIPVAVAARPSAHTYLNPVDASFADTFADPSVIHAKDGWYYAYSTADPLRAGLEPGVMHIARTKDFRSWQYEGTVFTAANRPAYATATAGLWAPDIRYLNGRYVLYFTVTDTTLNTTGPGSADDAAIGMATAPSPTGPWTPSDTPLVAPRPGNGGFLSTIDPAMFTDVDGRHYLYWGSYNGGIFATRLNAAGTATVGTAKQVAIDNRYEGSYVVRHGRWYYLMVSSANCCAGPTTGYTVFSGRSRSPLGPFVDADGLGLLDSRVGGTLLITQNGNRWIGAGHHALFTDATGATFAAYRAIDRDNAWLTTPGGINRRPLLIDRVDWIDGWPRLRAGAGPSDTPQPVPVTGSGLGIDASAPATGLRGAVAGSTDPQSGATAKVVGTAWTRRDAPARSVRVRVDLRGSAPVTVTLGAGEQQVRVTVDRQRRVLRLRTPAKSAVSDLPAGTGWQTLVVQVQGVRASAQVSADDLGDPGAEVRLSDRRLRLRSAPVRFGSERALLDNLTIRRVARDAAHLVRQPRVGRVLDRDEFATGLDDGWSWVRRDAAASVQGGALSWPVQRADLTGPENAASVLLRDTTPAGDWVSETKVTLDLGTDTVRNYQQAGLVAYVGDDDFARLSTVAIWNTRQTEFGRELPDPSPTDASRLSYGGALVGTPAPTVWLRLARTTNPAGEQLYRAGTSRDGRHWTWGATWVFPAAAHPRIGLVAHGSSADTPDATARFAYLRFYAAR